MNIESVQKVISQGGASWLARNPAQVIFDELEKQKAFPRKNPVTDAEHEQVCVMVIERVAVSNAAQRATEPGLGSIVGKNYSDVLAGVRNPKKEEKPLKPLYRGAGSWMSRQGAGSQSNRDEEFIERRSFLKR